MKKIFVLSAFFGLASMAQAAFIQCTPGQGTVVNSAVAASQVFSCLPSAGGGLGATDDNLLGDGFDVISIQLRVSGTFQNNNGTVGQLFSVLYSSINTLGALSPGNPSCTANAITDGNFQALGACVNTTGAFGIAPIDVVNPFSVTVFGGAGSNPLPFNASASVFYQVVTNQQSSVPEPSTYMLLSLGFLAFAFIRRK